MPPFHAYSLALLAYAQGFSSWHYKARSVAETLTPNFFTPAGDMLSRGDHITVSAPDGTAVLAVVGVGASVSVVAMMRAEFVGERVKVAA